MNSNIIQISKQPINKNCYISATDYDKSWFVGNIAHYVTDMNEEEQKYILKRVGFYNYGIIIDTKNRTLTVVSKTEYFENKFKRVKEAALKLMNMSLDEFAGFDGSIEIRKIQNAGNNKYGFYVDDRGEHYGLINFDTFMRCAEDGDVYYIGGIVNYNR